MKLIIEKIYKYLHQQIQVNYFVEVVCMFLLYSLAFVSFSFWLFHNLLLQWLDAFLYHIELIFRRFYITLKLLVLDAWLHRTFQLIYIIFFPINISNIKYLNKYKLSNYIKHNLFFSCLNF